MATKKKPGRPRSKPEYHEGPQAANAFLAAMKRILTHGKGQTKKAAGSAA